MNKDIEKVFSEMKSKYGITGKTPIGELPNIMSKADWLLFSCFLKYPNGVLKNSLLEVNNSGESRFRIATPRYPTTPSAGRHV